MKPRSERPRQERGETTSAQSKHGGAKVRAPPPFVYLGMIIGGALLQRSPWALWLPFAPWLRVVAGSVFALSGLVMVLSARAWFTRTGQDPAPWKPSPELLVQGIYRHTRNPMYVGLSVFQLGLGVALGNLWIAAFAPIALIVVHFSAVRAEEAYLSEKFGDRYLRYQAAVRRYL